MANRYLSFDEHKYWTGFLCCRPCPPPTWWVGEAIERGISHTELRAYAAACLLAPPILYRVGPAPYLPALPSLARVWKEMHRDHDEFLCLKERGMPPLVHSLVLLSTARDAMEDPKAPGLVPELQEACVAVGDAIRALVKSGIPLSARNTKLTAEEREELAIEIRDGWLRMGLADAFGPGLEPEPSTTPVAVIQAAAKNPGKRGGSTSGPAIPDIHELL